MLKFKNVLYIYSDAVDNSAALKKVVKLTKKNQANLTVLFTMTDDPLPNSLSFAKDKIESYIAKKEAKRDSIIAELSNSISIKKESIYSNSYIEVIKKIQQHSYDLLIKPSENEGVIGKIFGSNDMGYLRQSPCPVWLIKNEEKDESQSIIAAIDVSSDYPEDEITFRKKLNIDVLNTAIAIAEFSGYRLKIISAWSAKYESSLRDPSIMNINPDGVNEYVHELKKQHLVDFDAFMASAKNTLGKEVIDSINPECISIKGSPNVVIPEYAKQINTDLVVMATVARVGIPGLLIGNTAENILYQLDQSVLAIKPAGFNSLIAE